MSEPVEEATSPPRLGHPEIGNAAGPAGAGTGPLDRCPRTPDVPRLPTGSPAASPATTSRLDRLQPQETLGGFQAVRVHVEVGAALLRAHVSRPRCRPPRLLLPGRRLP